MTKEIIEEIIDVIKRGEVIICDTTEQRDEIIRTCCSAGLELSGLTHALANGDWKTLHSVGISKYEADSFLCLRLISDVHLLCIYTTDEVKRINSPQTQISSFFAPSESDSSDFGNRFALLLGQETG